ncbi:MAG: AAA family ATPase [Chloroflexi bacterium]|nr:AAA family ATPase [Chloroflexota bacterium]
MKLDQREWLVEDWMPIGHKVMDTNTEGGFKTILGCWIAVCVASGNLFFGKKVKQGPVLMIDEETPYKDLTIHLERFSQGLGYKSWEELPITVRSMEGFRFGRKEDFNKLFKVIKEVKPVFIRFDSVLACLPGGREGMEENSDKTGIAMRDDLNRILDEVPECTIMIAAHAKKLVAEYSMAQLKESEMVSVVRGHGSIVGQACDTGLMIKKISEHPKTSRFVLITKPKRCAIPAAAKDVFVEIEEEAYGKGPASLKEISPMVIPPSKIAKDLFPLFSEDEAIKASKINSTAAFYTKKDNKMGVEELIERKVVTTPPGEPFSYLLNRKRKKQADENYLTELEKVLTDREIMWETPGKSARGRDQTETQRFTRKPAKRKKVVRIRKTQLGGVCEEN